MSRVGQPARVTGAGCRGRGCGLQNSHPRPTLTRSAGYPNPLRVRHRGHGFPFFDISDIMRHLSAPPSPPTETSCRCKSPWFFCSSKSVNCGSEQKLHIDQQSFSQSTKFVALRHAFRISMHLLTRHFPSNTRTSPLSPFLKSQAHACSLKSQPRRLA
jgi:hypothetical protein